MASIVCDDNFVVESDPLVYNQKEENNIDVSEKNEFEEETQDKNVLKKRYMTQASLLSKIDVKFVLSAISMLLSHMIEGSIQIWRDEMNQLDEERVQICQEYENLKQQEGGGEARELCENLRKFVDYTSNYNGELFKILEKRLFSKHCDFYIQNFAVLMNSHIPHKTNSHTPETWLESADAVLRLYLLRLHYKILHQFDDEEFFDWSVDSFQQIQNDVFQGIETACKEARNKCVNCGKLQFHHIGKKCSNFQRSELTKEMQHQIFFNFHTGPNLEELKQVMKLTDDQVKETPTNKKKRTFVEPAILIKAELVQQYVSALCTKKHKAVY
jgi:hypothetical protein